MNLQISAGCFDKNQLIMNSVTAGLVNHEPLSLVSHYAYVLFFNTLYNGLNYTNT